MGFLLRWFVKLDQDCWAGLKASQDPTLRPRIWKILLRVGEVPADTFLGYVARGPCEVREKIRNDTFRSINHVLFTMPGLILSIEEHSLLTEVLRNASVKICSFGY